MSIAPISSSTAAMPAAAMAPTVTPSTSVAAAATTTGPDRAERPGELPKLEADKPMSEQQANQVVTKLNLRIESVHSSVRFRVDDTTGKTVITVMNTDSGEVIRQIPNEEALRLAEALKKDQGTIINTKA